MTNSVLIDRLGNWNPQLLRELRGRLKPQTVIAAVSFSVIFQIILLLITSSNSHLFSDGWLDLWQIITWMLPYVTFTIGSYWIVNDIGYEQKRGTLNFIRLSPCPAWQILLGKMLGVPVLLYIFLGLMVPLHCFAGLQAGVSLPLIASVYLMLAPGCAICYSVVMLCGLPSETQRMGSPPEVTAFGVAAIACFCLSPLYMGWNIYITWRPLLANPQILGHQHSVVSWFLLPINTIGLVSHAFSLAVLGTTAFLLWRILLRHFNKPRSTPLSKRQSYAILAGVEVFLLPSLVDGHNATLSAISMYILTVILLLVLMFAICPQRQALLEWVRYDSPSWQSLIWSDRSPLLLAVVIHLIMASALLIPWLFWGIGTQKLVETSLLVLCTTNTILIYATFVQQLGATKIRNPILGWFLAPILLLWLELWPDRIPATATLWTLFGYGFWQFDKPTAIPFVGLGILAQWLFMAFLLRRFQKTMQKLKAGT